MKIDIRDQRFSPYIYLSDALHQWASKNGFYYEDLIVDIRTSNLGNSRIIAIYDGCFGYDYNTDWYEGGDLELLGITPVSEIGETKYKM